MRGPVAEGVAGPLCIQRAGVMKGMEYLMDRPACEWPELVKMKRYQRPDTREHRNGWTPRKRSNYRSSTDKTGQATRARQRDLILKRWGAVCHICWDRGITDHRAVIDLDLAWPHPRCFTRDHVIPRSLGGKDDISNLKPAHHACNRDRGNGPVIPEPEIEMAEDLEMAA